MQAAFKLFRRELSLADWERRAFWPGVEDGPGPRDRRDSYERGVALESPGPPEPEGAHRRLSRSILAFEVFPPSILSGVLRRAPVENGDTVGLCCHIIPGLDLYFAARVVNVFDGPEAETWKTGFTYRTLVGHPELGEETFSVEKDLLTGRVRAALRSWSRPGTLLAKLFSPAVRALQVHASRAALAHLQAIAAAPKK